jgi:hypothetical protein
MPKYILEGSDGLRITGFLDFVCHPVLQKLENTMFRKQIQFPKRIFYWLALSKGPNWVGVFPPHLRMETDPVSEMLCFLVSRILDDGWSPRTQ